MLGLLLNLNGPATREDVEDLFLRWAVTWYDSPSDDDVEEPEDAAAVGTALAAACFAWYDEERDGEVLGSCDDPTLESVVIARFKQTWLVKIRRAIARRGGDPANRDAEDAAEAWPWPESIDLSKAVLSRRLALKVADGIADLEVARTTALWDWHAAEEKRRSTTASAGEAR